jgi:hypothetical protein
MNQMCSQSFQKLKLWLAVATVTAAANASIACADEADAKRLLKSMSDYLAAQKAISFEYDTSFEVVTREHQKVALASSGKVVLNRPNKLRATRQGGFADVELVFDGTTVSLLGRGVNLYMQAEAPGTVDQLVDTMRDKFHRPLPAADLLMSDPYRELTSFVTDVKDFGSGVIRGTECDHLAFRTKEFDWQIWIAESAQPYPCRYVITTTQVEGWPQYTFDVRSWKTGSEVAADEFKFTPPSGAQMVRAADELDVDDLPAIFSVQKE